MAVQFKNLGNYFSRIALKALCHTSLYFEVVFLFPTFTSMVGWRKNACEGEGRLTVHNV